MGNRFSTKLTEDSQHLSLDLQMTFKNMRAEFSRNKSLNRSKCCPNITPRAYLCNAASIIDRRSPPVHYSKMMNRSFWSRTMPWKPMLFGFVNVLSNAISFSASFRTSGKSDMCLKDLTANSCEEMASVDGIVQVSGSHGALSRISSWPFWWEIHTCPFCLDLPSVTVPNPLFPNTRIMVKCSARFFISRAEYAGRDVIQIVQ